MKINIPLSITPELAEETGWHIGDGSMNIYNHKDGLHIFSGNSLFIWFHYITKLSDRELADNFITSIAYGSNLHKGSPIIALRNRLAKDMHNIVKLSMLQKKALLVITWNAYVKDKNLINIVWRSESDGKNTFPKIIGDESAKLLFENK